MDLEEWSLYFSKDSQGHSSYKNHQLSTESVSPGLEAGNPFLKAARQARLKKVKEGIGARWGKKRQALMLQCGYEVEKQSHVLLELIKNGSANFKGIIRDRVNAIGELFY